MKRANHEQFYGLLDLLSPAAQREPCTYHRRGRWFNSSIAHWDPETEERGKGDNVILSDKRSFFLWSFTPIC